MRNGPYELIVAPANYPGKKYRGRYAYEHIVNWWKANDRMPPVGFEIHHKNGDHRDNRLNNLQLVSAREHRLLHGALLKKRITIKCAVCGVHKELNMNSYRYKRKQKYKNLYCSRTCQHVGITKKFRCGETASQNTVNI